MPDDEMNGFKNLHVQVLDSIATITIDRPEKLNSLDAVTIEQLRRAVETIRDTDEVRGAIVTGTGTRAFAAGADIAELARTGADAANVSRRGQAAFRAVEMSRKPFIAAVNGFALGGGCELALACHLRVAASTARFGLPEVKLGTIPGYGGTVRLPRIVGRARALELVLTGEMIDASEAHRIGLVNRVVEPDDLLPAARSLLTTILANGPVAVAMAIDAVVRGAEMSDDDAFAREANFFGLLGATEDANEGMTAFLEKRPPTFRGR